MEYVSMTLYASKYCSPYLHEPVIIMHIKLTENLKGKNPFGYPDVHGSKRWHMMRVHGLDFVKTGEIF
jgi:hypothetical protein